ncbi:MAG TPA: WD40 repeat domain-containing protein [Fimbriiglobus sp.]|nr:WD40 repeat domain-containing protein [Fimbriiglobus sp.]
MPRALAVALVALVVAPLSAQDAPTAEQAKEAIDKFQAERAESAKTFAAAELAAADELASSAEAALKDGNASAAARFVRDARWQLPFLPAGLPQHVSRVLGVSRLRHGDRVNALSYSPDGTRLASASRDGTVKVWDLGNGRELVTYRGHLRSDDPEADKANAMKVPGIAFCPDGKSVASSGGKDIHVWDAATGKLLHSLAGHTAPARGLTFADANTLVSGGDDRKLIVWDVAAGKPAQTFPEQAQRIEAVAVGGGGKLVATINAAGELAVYPLKGDQKTSLLSSPVTDGGAAGYGVAFVAGSGSIITCGGDHRAKMTAGPDPAGSSPGSGATVRTYAGHAAKLNALGVTPDGKLLVTGSDDKTVRVWDVAGGKQLYSFQGHPEEVTAVAVRPDGKQAASGSVDGSIKLWPLSATDEHRASTEATDSVWAVAVSPDGKQIVSGGADKAVRVYDAGSGKLVKTLTGHKGAVPAVTFVGNAAVASASGDKLVKVWDVASGNAADLVGHGAAVLAVAADGAGRLLVSGSADRSVRGWDPATGKVLWTWSGKSAVCALAVRTDGKRVAVGTADGWLTLLAPAGSDAPKVVGSVSAHGAGVAGVALSPDGSRAVTCGGDGLVRVWNLPESGPPTASGKFETPTRNGPDAAPVTAVAWSADGRLIASAGADGVTRVWDVQAGNEVRGFRGHTEWVTSVGFLPDGKGVVSAGVDKAVRLFELASREMASPPGHTQPVRGVAISRDGKFAATGSLDKTVRVWDLSSGKEIAVLVGATDAVNTVSFAGPNTVVAAGTDQKLRWWTVDPPKETRTAPIGPAFFMTVAPDGKRVAVVSTRDGDKQAVCEVFTGAAEPTQLTDKGSEGNEVRAGTFAADATIGVIGWKDGVVRLWDLGKKDRLGSDWALFKDAVGDLALTPDKKTLVAIDANGTVKVADVAKREDRKTFAAVDGTVAGLVMSPTGDRFATLSAEGEVKVWGLDGQELRSWALPSPPGAAAFTPDGKKLVTGNADGTACVLELP